MQALVGDAMRQGAVGVGSSLIYAPAFYARTDELVALAHGVPDERLHSRQLLRSRSAILVSQLVNANGRRADEGSDVRTDAPSHEVVQVLAQGGPFDVEPDVTLERASRSSSNR